MQISLRIGLVAVLAIVAPDAVAHAQSTESNLATGPWTSRGLPYVARNSFRVPTDPDLRFIIRDGSTGWAYASCTSEAPGQPSIRSEEALPVGNGRALVCTTHDAPVYSEQMLQGRDGSFYCWKGAASKYRTVSDARLQTTVTQTSASGPWTLRATSYEAWTVKPVAAFGGASAWPLWLEIFYETVDFAPARNFSCDGVL